MTTPRATGLVLAAVLALAGPAFAERPATLGEHLVYDNAAGHLRSIGVNVPTFRVAVDDGSVCGPVAVACSYPGIVYLSPDGAVDALRYYRSARHTVRWRRALALDRCADVCLTSAQVALHELVHQARFVVHPLEGWVGSDRPFEEGLAEAVAVDQLSPMIFRASGLRGAMSPGYVYAEWVDRVWSATGGETGAGQRRARLDAVATPSIMFSIEATP